MASLTLVIRSDQEVPCDQRRPWDPSPLLAVLAAGLASLVVASVGGIWVTRRPFGRLPTSGVWRPLTRRRSTPRFLCMWQQYQREKIASRVAGIPRVATTIAALRLTSVCQDSWGADVVVAVVAAVNVGAADRDVVGKTVTRDKAEVDVAVGSGLEVEEDWAEAVDSVADGDGIMMRLVVVTTTTVVSTISTGAMKLIVEKIDTEQTVEIKVPMAVFRSVRTLWETL